jgi:predicted dehydrogenase
MLLRLGVNAGRKLVKKKFSTAIVGHWQALNVLLPAFQSVPDFKVAALCGRNGEATRAAAVKAGVAKAYRDWEALVEDPEIEVVALALPAFLQARAAVALAASGKHLFCEKPLAADLAGAQAVCAAVSARQRVAAVNFGFRTVEAFRDFHSIAKEGMLGAPQLVMVEWLLSTRCDPTLAWNWKSDARQGGGTLNLMASHVLDYLSWFLGEIVKVRLQTAAWVPFRPDGNPGHPKKVEADDTCNLLMTLARETPASVTVSTALGVPGGHRVRVWFEKGLLELANTASDDYQDGFKLSFQPGKNAGRGLGREVKKSARLSQMKSCHPGRVAVTRRVVEEYALALRGRENRAPTLDDALKVQKYIEMARQSGW